MYYIMLRVISRDWCGVQLLAADYEGTLQSFWCCCQCKMTDMLWWCQCNVVNDVQLLTYPISAGSLMIYDIMQIL